MSEWVSSVAGLVRTWTLSERALASNSWGGREGGERGGGGGREGGGRGEGVGVVGGVVVGGGGGGRILMDKYNLPFPHILQSAHSPLL